MANQPPFAEYPRPGQPFINPSSRPPGVYFDAIGEAWGYVRQDMGNWIGGTLLMFIVTYAMLIPIALLTGGFGAQQTSYPALGLRLVLNIVPGVVSQMLMSGLIGMGVRQLRGESISLAMMFDPFKRFGPNFLACLLYVVAIYVSALLCVIPVLFVAPVLALMPTVALMKEVDASTALRMSYEACKSYWVGLLGLLIVSAIIAALGGCACGIGILFTYPIFFLVLAIHYRAFFESSAPEYGIPPTAV